MLLCTYMTYVFMANTQTHTGTHADTNANTYLQMHTDSYTEKYRHRYTYTNLQKAYIQTYKLTQTHKTQ